MDEGGDEGVVVMMVMVVMDYINIYCSMYRGGPWPTLFDRFV